ncbi:MAG: cyclophilin-like fold protein [Lachnospiraceae bacterium]|nr:cyclophilin-like fold protein [Lachnospiraceae bacterium]
MEISIKSSDYEIIYELNNSQAAKELYAQLPLTIEVEPFSNNEMTFYPPKKLSVSNTPLSGGAIGSLSYYVPWGDVVMFYAPCPPNGSLYELGSAVSGTDNIRKLSGTITISAN